MNNSVERAHSAMECDKGVIIDAIQREQAAARKQQSQTREDIAVIRQVSEQTHSRMNEFISETKTMLQELRDNSIRMAVVGQQQEEQINLLFTKDRERASEILTLSEKLSMCENRSMVRMAEFEEKKIKPIEAFMSRHDTEKQVWKDIRVLVPAFCTALILLTQIWDWLVEHLYGKSGP